MKPYTGSVENIPTCRGGILIKLPDERLVIIQLGSIWVDDAVLMDPEGDDCADIQRVYQHPLMWRDDEPGDAYTATFTWYRQGEGPLAKK